MQPTIEPRKKGCPFFTLSAELHEQIFDQAMTQETLLSPNTISIDNLLVSKAYHSRALRSYHRHRNITISDTPLERSNFERLPEKSLITTITFIGRPRAYDMVDASPDSNFNTLSWIVAQCPRLTHLNIESLVPWTEASEADLSELMLYFKKWWELLQHIPNVTVSKAKRPLSISEGSWLCGYERCAQEDCEEDDDDEEDEDDEFEGGNGWGHFLGYEEEGAWVSGVRVIWDRLEHHGGLLIKKQGMFEEIEEEEGTWVSGVWVEYD